jgi:hypothetical protein
MISGARRSAKISAPRAMGQYCPQVLTTPVLRTRLSYEVQILDFTAHGPRTRKEWNYVELEAAHDAMVDQSQAVIDIISGL